MNIKLKIWRQKNRDSKGYFETYSMSDIEEHMSFLEVLDLLNEQLFAEGKEPVGCHPAQREPATSSHENRRGSWSTEAREISTSTHSSRGCCLK